MDIQEYQAKKLFREVGIPVLPSQTINDPRQIKQLQIPYPVVLKSQVRAGNRGKAGGVRFVANTIDAIAAARGIFKLSILGEYPEIILAEAHYNTEKEFFLAVVLDYHLKRPVLLGSAYGGMNVESLLANLQQVEVEESFSLFYARRLTVKMGLSGNLIQSVSEIVAKMYRLFQEQDLDLIEINPLGVNSKNELMALDGKIKVNRQALARNPAIAALNLADKSDRFENSASTPAVKLKWLDWQEQKGNIAIICNSEDLALLTWDLISQQKGKPACGVVLENNNEPKAIGSATSLREIAEYQQQLQKTLVKLQTIQTIKVVLINIWSTAAISSKIMETVVNYVQLSSETNNAVDFTSDSSINKPQAASNLAGQLLPVKFVLRLLDEKQTLPHPELAETIYLTSNLEEAIEQTKKLVKL